MKTFEIPVEEIKQLNRYMYNIYKYFSEIVAGIESSESSWNTRHEINKKIAPHEYFKFRYGDALIQIHLHHDNTYSLELQNYVLTTIPPHKRRTKSSDYRYQNYYGTYEKLEDAVIDFSNVVNAIVDNKLGVLF